MTIFSSLRRPLSPIAYAIIAPLLLLIPNLVIWVVTISSEVPPSLDLRFWLTAPAMLLEIALMAAGSGWRVSAGVTLTLILLSALAAALVIVSFRRAAWAGRGYGLAAATVIPGIQLVAVLIIALLPRRTWEDMDEAQEHEARMADAVKGIVAGMAILVGAVLVSALTFGAYGWGLFVATPFVMGFTTGYIANRRILLTLSDSSGIVLMAGLLGSVALLMFALEGFACIVLIAPLALLAAWIGGGLGRVLANIVGIDQSKPFLCTAILPIVLVVDLVIPPDVPIHTSEQIEISAEPNAVWRALISDKPISGGPSLVGKAGLAYPLRSTLLGQGVGAERLGIFSTGIAKEEVTHWEVGRRLSVSVLSQPPAMEEMSPYRRVHAPHVEGYFLTDDTHFLLEPLPNGRTRLTIKATHELKVDPVPYWEPIARWAIRSNVQRVLASIKRDAEQSQRISRH